MFILAYDVETANGKNIGSICAIGWALLDNGIIVDSGYSLINPGCPFSKVNTSVHGIRAEDVLDAPSFSEYWVNTLSPLMKKSIVVAHSAGFDMAATKQALFDAGIEDPGIDYIDSIPVVKSFLDCASYKLSDLAFLAGHTYHEHNALEDAFAIVRVLEYVRNSVGLEDVSSLLFRSHVEVMNTKTDHYKPRHIVLPKASAHPSHCSDDVPPMDSLFADKRFCITGDVPGYERADLEKIIMEHSGRPTGAVSGKTDYLIVGEFTGYDPQYVSGKVRKALELQEQGGKIKIIHPEEFFTMLKQE